MRLGSSTKIWIVPILMLAGCTTSPSPGRSHNLAPDELAPSQTAVMAAPDPTGISTPTASPDFDLASLPEGIWTEISNMPFPVSEISGALLDGKFYVAGGLLEGVITTDLLQIYDVETNQWALGAEMPRGRNHHVTAALDGQVYFLEGTESLMPPPYTRYRTGYIYSVADNTWSRTAPAPANRVAASAVVLDDSIYVVGGMLFDPSAEGEPAARSAQRYTPAQDAWDQLATVPKELEHSVATTLNGAIYLTGGREPQPSAGVYRYDPLEDAWTEVTPMNEPRSAHVALVLHGKIYACGGERFLPETGAEAIKSCEIYDPTSDSWSYGPELPMGIHGLTGFVFRDTLYLVGGSDTPNDVDNYGRVLIWRPEH